MNIETMRTIDRYAGVPLCFLGTRLKKLAALFSPRGRSGASPRNVLFIELSEMGSAVLADPAMQKLKRTLQGNLYFAIFRKNSPSLGLLDTVPAEHTFRMRDSGFFAVLLDAARFLLWTRRNRIDTVIDLELFSRFTALLAGFSGASNTVGFHAFYNEGLYRGDFLTHKVAYNPHLHIAKNFLALVNALLSDRPEVPFSKTAIADAETVIRKSPVSEEGKSSMRRAITEAYPDFDAGRHAVVLFNTNASELVPLRRWPREHFIRLARLVLESYPRVLVLLTGEASERSEKEAIVRAVADVRCVDFAGRTSIPELPALYAVSEFMLTNDSGPAHFASVTNMPLFVLYGPETPKTYGSLGNMTPISSRLACSPCVSAANHRKSPCNENLCLRGIAPEEVFRILKPSLEALK